MNIYARFFDHEALTHSTEELIGFLASLDDINMTARLEQEIRDYVEGDMPYPKRYKVKPRIYFILIKTEAETMEQFKANNKSATPKEGTTSRIDERTRLKEAKLIELAEVKKGWYFVKMLFKRVLPIPGTTKFQYQDTEFQAILQAESGQDSYNKVLNHLKNRSDIDVRCQFPSTRGNNFEYKYLGEEIPTSDDAATLSETIVTEDTQAVVNAE